jgi:hypothetical protein
VSQPTRIKCSIGEGVAYRCLRAAAATPPALLLAVLLFAANFPSAIADPLQPNRPGQADPPTVVATGVVQVEGGFNFERETNDGPNVDTIYVPGIELRFGVLEGVEVQLAADGFVQEWRDGAELEFLFAWDIAERWNVNGNFDFASESQGKEDSNRHSLFRPQLALGLTLNHRVGAFVEYYGVIEDDAPNQHSVDAGATYLLSDDVQLDFSAGAGLNDSAPDYFVAAGVAWRVRALGI